MACFRISVTVLAVPRAVFAGFTATGVLRIVLRDLLATTTTLAVAALLAANVIAEVLSGS